MPGIPTETAAAESCLENEARLRVAKQATSVVEVKKKTQLWLIVWKH